MDLAGSATTPIGSSRAGETRGVGAPALLSALPDLGLAVLFASVWIRPDPARPGLAGHLMLIMLLEFVVVHSAAFMGTVRIGPGTPGRKAIAMLGLGVFYTLFVGGFALAFHQVWPLWSFWALILNRMMSVLLQQAPKGDEKAFVQRQWASGALFYLLAVGVTTVFPFPRLGVSPAAIAAMHLGGGGLWIDQPWRVLAAGTLYYAATAVSELFDHRWLPIAAPPAKPAR